MNLLTLTGNHNPKYLVYNLPNPSAPLKHYQNKPPDFSGGSKYYCLPLPEISGSLLQVAGNFRTAPEIYFEGVCK